MAVAAVALPAVGERLYTDLTLDHSFSYHSDDPPTEAAIEEFEDWVEESHTWTTPMCIGGVIDSAGKTLSTAFVQYHTKTFRSGEQIKQYRTFEQDSLGSIFNGTDWRELDEVPNFLHGVSGPIEKNKELRIFFYDA